MPSTNSKLKRIEPGTALQSYLYLKLKAGTDPGSVQVAGSPMPAGGGRPLSEEELTAVQIWIEKGAPDVGVVADPVGATKTFSQLLNACLPAADPITIKPLDAPPPEMGLQFELPSYALKANSEVENCTPIYYDFTDKVPPQFKDVEKNVIYVNGAQIRQDPQSHHLTLYDPGVDPTTLTDSYFTNWTCRGGERDGQPCDTSSPCGSGLCAGPTQATVGCIGLFSSQIPTQVANAQSATEDIPARDGVYWKLPLRGVLGSDSHAFNVTGQDTTLHIYVNFFYADNLMRELTPVNDTSHLTIAAGQAPFTIQSYCADYVVPQGWSMVELSTHTHRHGTHFWVNNPTGKLFYDSYSYSDPLYEQFNPWMNFNSFEPGARMLHYCATYDNGVAPDGTPDVGMVTRASKMPASSRCTPVACVAGKVAAACKADADCDSKAGLGDGRCDACPITAGTTTENEMFVLMPWFAQPVQSSLQGNDIYALHARSTKISTISDK